MSSSQQTTNLGLPIYGNNDVPDWRDTNTPFQTLDDIIGQGGGSNVIALMDFDNAVDLIGSTASIVNYTTQKAGAIIGLVRAQSSTNGAYLTIDGKVFDLGYSTEVHNIYVDRIPSGSVIESNAQLQASSSNRGLWFVPYKYQAVEPVINVYNEAEVELNYTTPLYDFASGTSYTCVKKCWLVGTLTNADTLTINNKAYGVANNDNGSAQIFLPLSRGDVVTLSVTSAFLKVLEGTVSGSISDEIGGLPNIDYDNPLHTGDNTTYTATGVCYAMAGVCGGTITLNGTVIARAFVVGNASYSTTSIPLLKLKSGDIIVTQGDARGTYMAIFPPL